MKKLLATMVMALCVQTLWAKTAVDVAVLRSTLEERFPNVKVESVQPSTVAGLYEVVTADRLVYTDAAGAHLILGQIMDTASKENLTEKRWNELNKIDFSSLPFEHAIKVVKGNGKHQLVAFEDPLCPYCAEFEKSMAALSDYTLYVFLLPLENIHPGSAKVSQSIWCADDKAAAWTDWMQQDKQPEVRNCDNVPADSLAALAKKHKISATPTLFFADGFKVSGALNAAELEKHWARVERKFASRDK